MLPWNSLSESMAETIVPHEVGHIRATMANVCSSSLDGTAGWRVISK